MVRFRRVGRGTGGASVPRLVVSSIVSCGRIGSAWEPWGSCLIGAGFLNWTGSDLASRPLLGIDAVRSSGSGLDVRGRNCLSNKLSPDVSAGPVRGPEVMYGSGLGKLPAPMNCALANSSNMFCVSTSPVKRAWALARPACVELMDQPIRSFMNSTDRFSTLCRFCTKSSAWCANENE
jgi:hypothetical protein